MRVVGKNRLIRAVSAGEIPETAARAWIAEALEAEWIGPADILKAYEDAEELDGSAVMVPLDNAGHCVVMLVEYRCGVVLVAYAGQQRGYRMRNRRTAGRS